MFISALLSVLTTCLNYIWTWFTPFWITIYFLTCLAPIYAVINVSKLKGTPELNEKYHSFARLDLQHWSWWKMPLMSIIYLMPLRLFACYGVIIFYVIFIQFILIGTNPNKPMGSFRFAIVNFLIHWLGKLHLWGSGVLFYKKSNPKVDYSKYLGPEWKPCYEGAGLQIVNH